MIKKLNIALLLVIILCGVTQASNTRFDSLVTDGINQIYNIKFNQAENTFSTVIREYPIHPAGYFLDAMILWWRILLEPDDESHDDLFVDKLDDVIDMCDDLLDEDPSNIDAIFFKGGALGFRGRLYAFRKNWFDAALDGKDALPLVYNAYKADSLNPDIQLGFGIYNYYASVVPVKYPFVKPFMIFFPEGNKVKGLEQLDYVAQNGKYARIESMYFLATSYYGFENNYAKAYEYTNRLTEMFPDNPKFQSLKGRIWIKRNDYLKSSEVFKEIYARCIIGMEGYNNSSLREASYYVGAQFEREGKLDSARQYFEVCESVSKLIDHDEESGFLINSVLYLAKIDRRQGNKSEAIRRYEEVLDYREYKNSHQKAEEALAQLLDKD